MRIRFRVATTPATLVMATLLAASSASGQRPVFGIHGGGPTRASAGVGVWLGPDPRNNEVGGAIALVEPGLRGGRASLGYAYALRGGMGQFVTARATALRTWKVPTGPRTLVGLETQVTPIFAIGPRLGAFVPVDRRGHRLLWILDVGIGL